MTAAAVRLRGFGYRPPGRSAWAVREVDLEIEPGEHVLLLGSSGSGKSTVLRAVAGLLDAGGQQVGSVEVDGVAAPRARDRVGLLLQDPDAQLVLSRAGEDVAFGPQNRGQPPDVVERQVAAALDAVGFPYSSDRPVAALSGGERQRLALAGVLALSPGVLLLDEPTSMLDAEGSALVRDAVRRAARATGMTLIVVEHRVDEWLSLMDRVVVLTPHGIVADGSPDAIRNTPAARDTWLVPPAAPLLSPRHPGEQLLTAARVCFRYRHATVDVLHDVDAVLTQSSVLAVTGSNGSGKTSLARLLGGLARPTSGTVTASDSLTGPNVSESHPHRWRARQLAGRVGSVFQNPEHSFLAGSVREELAIGPRALGRSAVSVAAIVDELLGRLRLDQLADANPFTLSGGEQRRLSVAAALATTPRVLVLDEPTFGQDPITWRELVALVMDLRDNGAAFAVATHDLPFRDAVSDRSLRLVAGRSAAS